MRRQRRHTQAGVELNLAAMLDMAFQLLAFFILTFKPPLTEVQVDLHVPPPSAVGKTTSGRTDPDPVQTPLTEMRTLVVDVTGRSGQIGQIRIGERNFPTLAQFAAAFANPHSTFDQVVIQATSDLQYNELMRVMDLCTRIQMAHGHELKRLSFREIAVQPEA